MVRGFAPDHGGSFCLQGQEPPVGKGKEAVPGGLVLADRYP